jgi:xanthine dehydrogenase small subunit
VREEGLPLEVIRAGSVRDAAGILDSRGGARLLGGGTLLVRQVTSGDLSITAFVLSDGLGLDRIEVDGRRVEIGAAVTMAQVASHPALAFLKPVACGIGGPAVRAVATVGGNLFAPYPFGDFAVALLALGAEVTVDGVDRSEAIDLGKFLAQRKEARGRVVCKLAFDLPPEGAFRFVKVVRRRPHGAAVLSIAALLPIEGGVVRGARIAYGAMAPTPMRARVVERVLEGKPLNADTVQRAEAAAAEGCAPLSDPFASAWYRLNVLPVYLKRLLLS